MTRQVSDLLGGFLYSNRVQAVTISAFYFCYFGALGVFIPFGARYLDHIGQDSVAIGILMAAITATKIIAPNLWAWLADKFNCHVPIVRLGAILALISFIVLSFVTSFVSLLVVLIAFGFFWNAILAQIEVLALELSQRSSTSYSQMRLWGSVGFIIFASAMGWSIDVWGISSFIPIMLVLFGIMMIVSLALKSYHHAEGHVDTHNKKGLIQTLKDRDVILFFSAFLFLQASHSPYHIFFDLYLYDFGYSSKIAGLLFSLGVVSEIVIFLITSRLIAKYGWFPLIWMTFAITALRWLVLALFVDNPFLLTISQLLHAATFGIAHAVAVYWLYHKFPGKLKGQGQALYSSLTWGIGGVLGNLMAGILWVDGQGAHVMFFVASLLAVVGLVVITFIKRSDELAVKH
ncbi:MAG: MFS transporter [Pseudomonadota bacterium]